LPIGWGWELSPPPSPQPVGFPPQAVLSSEVGAAGITYKLYDAHFRRWVPKLVPHPPAGGAAPGEGEAAGA